MIPPKIILTAHLIKIHYWQTFTVPAKVKIYCLIILEIPHLQHHTPSIGVQIVEENLVYAKI